jgi:hypothetical protein
MNLLLAKQSDKIVTQPVRSSERQFFWSPVVGRTVFNRRES